MRTTHWFSCDLYWYKEVKKAYSISLIKKGIKAFEDFSYFWPSGLVFTGREEMAMNVSKERDGERGPWPYERRKSLKVANHVKKKAEIPRRFMVLK